MRNHRLVILAVAALGGACGRSRGSHLVLEEPPSPPARPSVSGLPADPEARLPLGPKVEKGVLENGLTYFVRENRRPEKRAELWLVVDAGSINEDPDQRGLAHFVEHMAFNGTREFPKNQLLDALQRMGVKFGPHVNAETLFDRTVYKLQVPTDDPAALDLAMRVLAEWAGGLTFLPEDVDAERGVVLAEKRSRQGPQMRLLEALVHRIFAGSRYADHIPIGDPAIIKTATPATLRRFYRDWYRPGNMAVVAVGDFDGDAIEAAVRRRFAGLEAAKKPRPQPQRALPRRHEPTVLGLRDAELPVSAVVVGRVMPRRALASMKDFRRSFVEGLAALMMRERLEEARQRGDARYLMAAGGPMPLVRAADGFGFFAAVKPDDMRRGLDDLLAELERARRHGFAAAELERAEKKMLARMQSAAREAEADRESSTDLVQELVRHFLSGEEAAGRGAELAMMRHFSRTVRPAEAQAVVDDLLSADDLVIASLGPSGAQLLPRGEALATLRALPGKQLAAHREAAAVRSLIDEPPAPGKVVAERRHPDVGVSEWKLSNGATVLLKPTRFRKDQVLFLADSPGGHSLSSVGELRATFAAAEVARRGGLGKLDATALEKALAGRRVEVTPFIGAYDEGVRASSSPRDLEAMMQLVHLSFRAPRRDPRAFERWRESTLESVRLAKNQPDVRFARRLARLRANGDPRELVADEALVEGLDLDRSLALYRDRMKDAGDFTFFVVGSFELEAIKPLVERYLASLPGGERREAPRLESWPINSRARRLSVRDGQTQRARLSYWYQRAVDPDRLTAADRAAWKLFGDALDLRLLALFREQLGETYSVASRAATTQRRHRATLEVSFDCAPSRAAALEKRLGAEIRRAVRRGVGNDYLEKARKAALAQLETDLTDNAYWRRALREAVSYGRPLGDVAQERSVLEAIRPADVARAARRLIDVDRPVIGVLLPE